MLHLGDGRHHVGSLDWLGFLFRFLSTSLIPVWAKKKRIKIKNEETSRSPTTKGFIEKGTPASIQCCCVVSAECNSIPENPPPSTCFSKTRFVKKNKIEPVNSANSPGLTFLRTTRNIAPQQMGTPVQITIHKMTNSQIIFYFLSQQLIRQKRFLPIYFFNTTRFV